MVVPRAAPHAAVDVFRRHTTNLSTPTHCHSCRWLRRRCCRSQIGRRASSKRLRNLCSYTIVSNLDRFSLPRTRRCSNGCDRTLCPTDIHAHRCGARRVPIPLRSAGESACPILGLPNCNSFGFEPTDAHDWRRRIVPHHVMPVVRFMAFFFRTIGKSALLVICQWPCCYTCRCAMPTRCHSNTGVYHNLQRP